MLVENRGGAAADALAVRMPGVERAVDDRGRAVEPFEAPTPSWEEDLGYEPVKRGVKGIPGDAVRSVLFLECTDGKVESVSVEGKLEMLAGGQDMDLAYKKFESKKLLAQGHRSGG